MRGPGRLSGLTLAMAGLTVLGCVLLIAGVAIALRNVTIPPSQPFPRPPSTTRVPIPGGFLFCTWNAENLFDDQDDPHFKDDLEDWYGRDPQAIGRKLALLTDSLLRLNQGRGPDVLALVEVENRRAVELLRATLNARLPDAWDYPEAGLIHRDNRTGRRIEPAILTRLPAREAYPAGFGTRRILASRIEGPDGSPLLVLAAHWTSRLGGEKTEAKREAYAEVLYRTFLDAYRRDPAADVLICGDFNDQPDDSAVTTGLHTTDDPTRVRPGPAEPWLLNLMAGRDPRGDGTYLYNNRWEILDHIIVSPGLLDDRGWRVRLDTLQVVNGPELRGSRNRGPLRFGNEHNPNPRGPSDHFAVAVGLAVAEPATPAP